MRKADLRHAGMYYRPRDPEEHLDPIWRGLNATPYIRGTRENPKPYIPRGEDLYPQDYKEGNEFVPLKEFEEVWKLRGKDPKERKALLDERRYETKTPKGEIVERGKAYVYHKPTWTERLIKEPMQGIAGGIGNIADIGAHYVNTPALFLGSKALLGAAKVAPYEREKQRNKKWAKELQSLSDKYWNQNKADEWRNADIFKTKNRDATAAMLRGAGEFLPDLVLASMFGGGTRVLTTAGEIGIPVVKPLAKGFKNKIVQLWKEPKMPKIAEALEVPITGKNAAGFAGAGAGHGYINTDTWGDRKKGENAPSWYTELPFMMLGAGAGSGLYSAGKGSVKKVAKGISNKMSGIEIPKSSEELSIFRKWLANRINKGNNKLDEKFINLSQNLGSNLNAFNIYKNNKVPFELARKNSIDEYSNILPESKKYIHDKTLELLDKSYVPYDKNNPKSDFSHSSHKIAKKLRDQYDRLSDIADKRYDITKTYKSKGDRVNPAHTINALKDIYSETLLPYKKDSAIGELHEITANMLGEILHSEHALSPSELLNQKRAIRQIAQSAPAEIGGLGSREIKLLENIVPAIDRDLAENSSILREEFLPSRTDADTFFAKHIIPFRQSKVFRNLISDLNTENLMADIINDKNKSAELKRLLDINEYQDKNIYSPSAKIRNDILEKLTANKTYKNRRRHKASDIIDHEVNYIDDTKNTLDWIKRLESQKRLFDNKNVENYNVEKLLDEIANSSHSAVYKPELTKELKHDIRPFAKKYLELLGKDKQYKSGLTNTLYDPNYYGNKYDIYKHIHHWPTIAGGAAGAQMGGYLGGVIGAAAGGLFKSGYSKLIFNAMTDKQFVNELIKLGRLPKEDKQKILRDIKSNPALKTEIIRLMFEKKDE